MKYLGIDVHADATVWCLLDEAGTQLGTGRTKTSSLALCELATSVASLPVHTPYVTTGQGECVRLIATMEG